MLKLFRKVGGFQYRNVKNQSGQQRRVLPRDTPAPRTLSLRRAGLRVLVATSPPTRLTTKQPLAYVQFTYLGWSSD